MIVVAKTLHVCSLGLSLPNPSILSTSNLVMLCEFVHSVPFPPIPIQAATAHSNTHHARLHDSLHMRCSACSAMKAASKEQSDMAGRAGSPRAAATDTSSAFAAAGLAGNSPTRSIGSGRHLASGCSLNFSPQIIHRLGRELQELVSRPPEGCTYVPNDEETLAEIHADIAEGTPYHGGCFRVRLVLGCDYPAVPPKAFFLTKIFHPNVSNVGDICVNTLKKDWTSSVTLSHVLKVIHCLLIVPFPESSLNDEAGKLFLDGYDEYFRRARLLTQVHAMPLTSSSEKKMAAVPAVPSSLQSSSAARVNSLALAASSTSATTSGTEGSVETEPQQRSGGVAKAAVSQKEKARDNRKKGLKRL